MNLSTYNLIQKIQSGDKASYKQFFHQYYKPFCAYANQYVDFDDAEETVQDVMMMLWERRTLIDADGEPIAYLIKSIKNRCLKKIARQQEMIQIHEVLPAELNYDDPDFYVVDELNRKIELILAQMPSSYREAFEKHRFQHKTYNEIADELGISKKTVDYRIQQALKIMRVQLKEYLPLLLWL